MPYNEVFDKFKAGALHSGSKKGPAVKNHKQAVAIFLHEKEKAGEGDTEYDATSGPLKGLKKAY